MGKLGFVFDIIRTNDNIVFFNNKTLTQNQILIFIEKQSLKGDYIVGLKRKFLSENASIAFLNKNLEFEPYLVFENPKFKYSKISLSEKTHLDFDHLTFWFHVTKYKKLWELLTIEVKEDFEQELKENLIRILEYFK